MSEHHAHARHPHLSARWSHVAGAPGHHGSGHLPVYPPPRAGGGSGQGPATGRASGSWRNTGRSPTGAVSFTAKATGHRGAVPKAVSLRRPRGARAQWLVGGGHRALGSGQRFEPAAPAQALPVAAPPRVPASPLPRPCRPEGRGPPLLLRTLQGNSVRPTASAGLGPGRDPAGPAVTSADRLPGALRGTS